MGPSLACAGVVEESVAALGVSRLVYRCVHMRLLCLADSKPAVAGSLADCMESVAAFSFSAESRGHAMNTSMGFGAVNSTARQGRGLD